MTDTPPRKIRAAIIGYGISGRLAHAQAGMLKNPEYAITAVCDLAEPNRRRAREELGCAVYDDVGTMLEGEELDLVSIITRSETHAALAIQCLRAGVHTLVTKPWALDAREATSILDAWKDSGRLLIPWLPIYWSPDFRKIKALIAEGAIGNVFLIRRHFSSFARRHDWQTESRYGGGYLLNWGAHIVEPVTALAASPVRSVYGVRNQVINPGDAEDNFHATLSFENGITGIAEYTQAVEGLPWFMVQGTRGMIRSNHEEIVLIQADPDHPKEKEVTRFPIEGKMFGDEAEIYADLARSILDGNPFPVTPEMAMDGTRVLDAIRRSWESNAVTSLES